MTVRIINTSVECGRIQFNDQRQVWRTDTLTRVLTVWPEQTARTFERERDAFDALLPMLKITHPGQHVVIQNGVVVDQDVSRQRLLRRFFGVVRGGEPVYVGFVGPQRAVRVPTPFFRRP